MVSVILGVLAVLAIGGLLAVAVKLRELAAEVRALTETLSTLSAPPAPAEEKTEKKQDPMDEGFENIMAFTVMGQSGFRDGEEP